MRSEADIMKKLNDEIDSYLTCPKFTVEEHAHNVTMLAWVLDISDEHLSEMIKESEASFGGPMDRSDYYAEE
ncbi:hypothetical protein SAMN04487928_1398 [Butyrivibrio proteoclasticus]|uniref:Uncharacterized protein n=1 Tax=Butyrivibrio proteoclasticus TaxID=43305 RepID=A0A1I5XZT2_9FIRM|nr:hypothetical protein [Butyrivibrio proteoclasticus]SFQ37217.1 hypothetical protein SAMN04487928_1398 [Butyrivibrio proteoclasticus]